MPTYKYTAMNLQKKKYKGLFIAEDEKDLAVQLTKQNLYLVSLRILHSRNGKGKANGYYGILPSFRNYGIKRNSYA